MLPIIAFVLTISILVFIHEFGHYYVAKIFGVKIEEFSIGFGKELYSRIDKEGVKWRIGSLPFGGYVKLYGYNQEDLDAKSQELYRDKTFFSKSIYARFLIVAAGPLTNYLLAIIIFASFYMFVGKVELPAIIGEVVINSPAARAGLKEDDRIIKIDGKNIDNFSNLKTSLLLNPTHQPMNLEVERKEEIIKIIVIPEKTKIGIAAKNEPVKIKMGILSSLYQGVVDVVDFSWLTLRALSQIIIGKRSVAEIGGPLTIANESGKSLQHSITAFVLFIAMLSVNLGLINLLPIPVLDGGHLMFIIYEAIARRPASKFAKNIALRIGTIMILFLVVISISNDIKNLIF